VYADRAALIFGVVASAAAVSLATATQLDRSSLGMMTMKKKRLDCL
jgi:hypothetical protein